MSVPEMVNVPSSENSHVIAACAETNANTLRKTSKIFFMFGNKTKNRAQTFRNPRPSIWYRQTPSTQTSIYGKVHVLYRTWNSSHTCSRMLKLAISIEENKSKQLNVILYMSRESVVAHPSVNKCVNWFCSCLLLKQTKHRGNVTVRLIESN